MLNTLWSLHMPWCITWMWRLAYFSFTSHKSFFLLSIPFTSFWCLNRHLISILLIKVHVSQIHVHVVLIIVLIDYMSMPSSHCVAQFNSHVFYIYNFLLFGIFFFVFYFFYVGALLSLVSIILNTFWYLN